MKTLQDQWTEYRAAVYPSGITGIQERETRMAFYAGALVILELACDRAHGLNEEEAFKSVGDLIREAQAGCESFILTKEARQ